MAAFGWSATLVSPRRARHDGEVVHAAVVVAVEVFGLATASNQNAIKEFGFIFDASRLSAGRTIGEPVCSIA
jgi:hypothetical protein